MFKVKSVNEVEQGVRLKAVVQDLTLAIIAVLCWRHVVLRGES